MLVLSVTASPGSFPQSYPHECQQAGLANLFRMCSHSRYGKNGSEHIQVGAYPWRHDRLRRGRPSMV